MKRERREILPPLGHTEEAPREVDGSAEPQPEPEPFDWSTLSPNFCFEVHDATPTSKKHSKDNCTEPAAQSNPLTEKIEPSLYKVFPAGLWESTQRYRKCTIGNETFKVHDVVLVAKDEAEPPLKRKKMKPTSSVAGIIKDRWVALILEVRAGDEQHVYLRVYWLFRPEDLPGGREPHHGAMEIIPSNDMQIIDAMCIDGRVEIQEWDEQDEDEDAPSDRLYWRQTLDSTKGNAGLSELRKHCSCRTPANPDNPLIQCSSCRRWLHAECIEKDALERAYKAVGKVYRKSSAANKKTKGTKGKGAQAKNGHMALFDAKIVQEGSNKRDRKSIIRITSLRDSTSTTETLRCLLCDEEID